jgi:hypothetical protein
MLGSSLVTVMFCPGGALGTGNSVDVEEPDDELDDDELEEVGGRVVVVTVSEVIEEVTVKEVVTDESELVGELVDWEEEVDSVAPHLICPN